MAVLECQFFFEKLCLSIGHVLTLFVVNQMDWHVILPEAIDLLQFIVALPGKILALLCFVVSQARITIAIFGNSIIQLLHSQLRVLGKNTISNLIL